jgi:hypothetical protein
MLRLMGRSNVNKFTFSGKSIELPAREVTPTCASFDPTAWISGSHLTVRLLETVHALRVHTNGRAFSDREPSHAAGRWILFGDVVLTSSQLADSRSLPTYDVASVAAFTHISEAKLVRDVVLNIGLASEKYAGRGGGFQAEYVRGPEIQFELLTGKMWHSRAGFA